MRIIVTSDLHQLISKWSDFVDVVGRERPRFVLVAGDLLPKEGGHSGQRDFFKKLKTYLLKMKDTTGVRPMMYFGNDDYHTLEPSLDELAGEGLCLNLNGRVHREEGLVFCGMNKVRDYPFGYKHWCVPDDEFVACPVQFCGQGLTLDEHGDYVLLDNLVAHLKAKPSISAVRTSCSFPATILGSSRRRFLIRCAASSSPPPPRRRFSVAMRGSSLACLGDR